MRGYEAFVLTLSTGILMGMETKQHEQTDVMFKSKHCCISSITDTDYIHKLFVLGMLTVESRDINTGNTLLHAKMIHRERFPISIKQLLIKGCSERAKNNDGKTALDVAQDELRNVSVTSKAHRLLHTYQKTVQEYHSFKQEHKPVKRFFTDILCCKWFKKNDNNL